MTASLSMRPTVAVIRGWPATVNFDRAAAAIGVSRAHFYELDRRGQLPTGIRTIKAGGRRLVVTSSILAALGEAS